MSAESVIQILNWSNNQVWNADQNSGNLWACERILEGHNSWVVSLSLGPDCIFSASNDGAVKVWASGKDWQCEKTYEESDFSEVYACLAYGVAGRTRLAFAGAGRRLTFLEG